MLMDALVFVSFQGSSWEEIVSLAQKLEAAGVTIINTGIGWHEARIPTIATVTIYLLISCMNVLFIELCWHSFHAFAMSSSLQNEMTLPSLCLDVVCPSCWIFMGDSEAQGKEGHC